MAPEAVGGLHQRPLADQGLRTTLLSGPRPFHSQGSLGSGLFDIGGVQLVSRTMPYMQLHVNKVELCSAYGCGAAAVSDHLQGSPQQTNPEAFRPQQNYSYGPASSVRSEDRNYHIYTIGSAQQYRIHDGPPVLSADPVAKCSPLFI